MSSPETVPGLLRGSADNEASPSPGAALRVSDARKCLDLLREVAQGAVPVSIGHPGGPAMSATLWAIDGPAARLHFHASMEGAAAMRDLHGLHAAAYLADVKLQFRMTGVKLGSGTGAQLHLVCDVPRGIYRLARRQGLRLRRGGSAPLRASVVVDRQAEALAEYEVLDFSHGGCGLWRSPDAPAPVPGQALTGVEFREAGETAFFADLQLQHASETPVRPGGQRLGCRWLNLSPAARQTLNRWMETGGRRRGRVTLDLKFS
ncbi:MAG: PilZ domain-containing protein [Rubrivivax sp.]|nr:PilZ domain-containing protein [Rubrivivax sp.]